MKKPSQGITSWPEDERPRERLLSRGSHALTDAELLAILLRVGVKGQNAVELGREVLKHFGSLHEMMAAPLSAWVGIKGLGEAKLAQLLAALELGRRAALPAAREKIVIKSTKQAADYYSSRLRGLSEEHFRIAFHLLLTAFRLYQLMSANQTAYPQQNYAIAKPSFIQIRPEIVSSMSKLSFSMKLLNREAGSNTS